MKTEKEITEKIEEAATRLDMPISFKEREVVEAILDVLENNLDSEEIEEKYYDEHQTDREQAANNARDWMDGDADEIDF